MRLAIADPPYPPQISERHDTASGVPRIVMRSRARRYYGDGSQDQKRFKADHHDDAGVWDTPEAHRALLEQVDAEYDGWAIATSLDGIGWYGTLPPGTRTLIWRKLTSTRGGGRVALTMEAVLVRPHHTRRGAPRRGLPDGRKQVSDFLQCEPPAKARFAGAKPPAWTRWVLDALGHQDGDVVDDLFPGSGYVQTEITQGVLL